VTDPGICGTERLLLVRDPPQACTRQVEGILPSTCPDSALELKVCPEFFEDRNFREAGTL
jgi:hypothetical protein